MEALFWLSFVGTRYVNFYASLKRPFSGRIWQTIPGLTANSHHFRTPFLIQLALSYASKAYIFYRSTAKTGRRGADFVTRCEE
jgi:hypothetical protein